MKKKTKKKVRREVLTDKQKEFAILHRLVKHKLITMHQMVDAILNGKEIEIALDHEYVTGFGGKDYFLP